MTNAQRRARDSTNIYFFTEQLSYCYLYLLQDDYSIIVHHWGQLRKGSDEVQYCMKQISFF